MTLAHDAAQIGSELGPALVPVAPAETRASIEKKDDASEQGAEQPAKLGFASDEAARLQAEREAKYLTGSE